MFIGECTFRGPLFAFCVLVLCVCVLFLRPTPLSCLSPLISSRLLTRALALHDGEHDEFIMAVTDLEKGKKPEPRRCFDPVDRKQWRGFIKGVMIAITQLTLPCILIYEEVWVDYRHAWDGWCRVEQESLYTLAGFQTALVRLVLFIFTAYLAVYGYYSFEAFLGGMYFEHRKYKYFDTVHQEWVQLGLVANTIATLSITILTALVLYFTDNVLDMILNALALIFIRELDNELVSGEQEALYVKRYIVWLELGYLSWTCNPDNYPEAYQHCFRHKQRTLRTRFLDFIIHSNPYRYLCALILMFGSFTPFWLTYCYGHGPGDAPDEHR